MRGNVLTRLTNSANNKHYLQLSGALQKLRTVLLSRLEAAASVKHAVVIGRTTVPMHLHETTFFFSPETGSSKVKLRGTLMFSQQLVTSGTSQLPLERYCRRGVRTSRATVTSCPSSRCKPQKALRFYSFIILNCSVLLPLQKTILNRNTTKVKQRN